MRLAMRLFAPLLTLVLFGTAVSQVHAATYQFDLSALVDGEGNLPQGLAVDLGTRFSEIETASIRLQGNFTPGKSKPFLFEDPWGVLDPPPETDDSEEYLGSGGSLLLWTSLGDESLPRFASPAHADWDLTGSPNQAELVSLLGPRGLFHDGVSTPLLDLSFLLDGKFHLTIAGLHVASLQTVVLENPTFDLSGLQLTITGTAVPEPAGAVLMACGCGLVVAGWRRCRGR